MPGQQAEPLHKLHACMYAAALKFSCASAECGLINLIIILHDIVAHVTGSIIAINNNYNGMCMWNSECIKLIESEAIITKFCPHFMSLVITACS